MAVESGSRAWGFASPDSDYDVRFIYVHEPTWYLTLFEERDVIETMLPGDLDISGWELRKALRLFSKCNMALNEWIGSPVVYDEEAGFRTELGNLIPAFFKPMGATYHYRSMAKQALSGMDSGGQITIKKFLYATRALLACRWIERHASQPPTEFQLLVDDVAGTEERGFLRGLLAQKALTAEQEVIVISPNRRSSILTELETYEHAATASVRSSKGPSHLLDAILRHCVGMPVFPRAS
jgi:uncharacterized protein